MYYDLGNAIKIYIFLKNSLSLTNIANFLKNILFHCLIPCCQNNFPFTYPSNNKLVQLD